MTNFDPNTTKHIQIGGRKLTLAVAQSNIVKKHLVAKFPQLKCSILALSTLGDQIQSQPLYLFGGKALWTKELETLLMQAIGGLPQLDMIVHSLKDVPTNLPEEFELGCILDRLDPRDVLVMRKGSKYKSLAELPAGTMVGTSSVRRSSQLMKNYPHLRFDSARGNINTRVQKLDAEDSPFECLLLAAAGLQRVGLDHRITTYLDAPDMYYAVGQGALGVETRKGDEQIKQLLQAIEDVPTSLCCHAERSLMRYLEGGCSVPIGVHTDYDKTTQVLKFNAIVVSPDGNEFVEDKIEMKVTTKSEADALGQQLGDKLIAKGAKEILAAINFDRINQPPVVVPSPAPSEIIVSSSDEEKEKFGEDRMSGAQRYV